jgi:hypothetical protein
MHYIAKLRASMHGGSFVCVFSACTLKDALNPTPDEDLFLQQPQTAWTNFASSGNTNQPAELPAQVQFGQCVQNP